MIRVNGNPSERLNHGAHNKTGERLDGLDLDAGVKFKGKAHQSLAHAGFEFAEGFAVADWQPSATECSH